MKTTKAKKELKPLTPPDTAQCQADKPNGHSFMTLGGVPGRERCRSKPTMIVRETEPAADGRCGSMSLCDECFAVFQKQGHSVKVQFERIAKG